MNSINYTSEDGRLFTFDYNLPEPMKIAANEMWDKDGNPIHHLRILAKTFKTLNNQFPPDLIIVCGRAGDAFMNNRRK